MFHVWEKMGNAVSRGWKLAEISANFRLFYRANSVMAVISETVIYKKLQMLPFVIISDSLS